jgi:putative peptidoglycan lipid II flippase
MNLLKTLAMVSSMTLVSRIFGFIRDAVLARVFGAGFYTDAFFVAFNIPNFLRRLFAEGVFSQAFVPVLAEYKNTRGQEATRKLISHTATLLGLTLSVIVAIGMLAAPLIVPVFAPGFLADPEKFAITVEMLRIVFPYILFISLTALAGGVLNTHRRFLAPAFTPVLLNFSFLTFALVLLPMFGEPVKALAWAVFFGGILQLTFLATFLARRGLIPKFSVDIRDEGVWRVLKLMGPAVVGVSVTQVSVLINAGFASFLATGSVSWLYYAQRLLQFPSGLLGAGLGTILLPSLAKYHAVKSGDEFSKLLDWGLRLALLLALPATVALVMLATPLTATLFLYGKFSVNDLAMVSNALMAYGLALPAGTCIRVFAPGFYARQDIKTPFRVAAACVVITVLMNAILIGPFAHVGLALAVSIGATLNASTLFTKLLRGKIYRPLAGWRGFGAKIAIALTAMACVIWLLIGNSAAWIAASALERIGRLSFLILSATAVYFGALWLMGFRPKDFSKRVLM